MSSTNMNTTTLKVLGGIILVLAVVGAYFYPRVGSQVAGAPAGASFGDDKISSQVVQVSTTTIFSQYNYDSSSRIIRGADIFLTGASSATSTVYAVTCATSTTASGPGASSASTILALTLSASNGAYYGTTTSPGAIYMASTSPGVTGTTSTSVPQDSVLSQSYNQQIRIWPAGSYLNCKLVTSGGSVDGLFDSGITGTITFPYRGQ